jgi:Pentapeptide repeats (8 copies)
MGERSVILLVPSMTTALQAWIAVIGGFATAVLGLLKYFNYRTRRDRLTLVGQAFAETVDSLASKDPVKQLAAAILLRRFFDRRTEQGTAGAPYQEEAIRVIAALLRATETSQLQKLLADGLAYAPSLRGADLQHCNLAGAYLGDRLGRRVDLSGADLYQADLSGASLRGATARGTVFYGAVLSGTVLENADLAEADLRDADLAGARFDGAELRGARVAGAKNVPPGVFEPATEEVVVTPPAGVPEPAT